jgi:hypothetical protein
MSPEAKERGTTYLKSFLSALGGALIPTAIVVFNLGQGSGAMAKTVQILGDDMRSVKEVAIPHLMQTDKDLERQLNDHEKAQAGRDQHIEDLTKQVEALARDNRLLLRELRMGNYNTEKTK